MSFFSWRLEAFPVLTIFLLLSCNEQDRQKHQDNVRADFHSSDQDKSENSSIDEDPNRRLDRKPQDLPKTNSTKQSQNPDNTLDSSEKKPNSPDTEPFDKSPLQETPLSSSLPQEATPRPNLLHECPLGSVGKIPDVDFPIQIKLNVNCTGASKAAGEAVKIAIKVVLSRLRVEKPHIYKKIKDNLGEIVLCGGTGGQAFPYHIPISCADEYNNGFDYQYTNFVHEFAHIIHFAINDTDTELSKEIQSLYRNEKDFVSDYSKQNAEEYFAESVAAWFNLGGGSSWAAYINRERLNKKSPKMYSFLSSIFCKPEK